MNSLISIIVPVYNLENYISRCIESILAQTYENWELILVDDGSEDNSVTVCESYAQENNRIRVIRKRNSGVSDTRNTGIAEAKGEYITFIDGDDFITADYLEYLYKMLTDNDCDMAYCGFDYAYEDGHTESGLKNDGKIYVTDSREALIKTFYRIITASSCCKLYKKSIFDNIKFTGYSLGEDAYLIYRILFSVKNVAFSNAPKYFYYCRENSAVHIQTDYYRYYDFVMLIDETEKHIDKTDKELTDAFATRFVENYFFSYMKLRRCDKSCDEEKKHISKNLKKYRKQVMLNRRVDIKTRIACLLSYFGMKVVDTVYDLFII